MTTRSVVAGFALLLVACPDRSPQTSRAWFVAHHEGCETVRRMLAEDHGLVTRIEAGHFGGLHYAAGAKGVCGSKLRGDDFPWTCTGGVVVNDVAAVDAFLGLPKGRLDAYARALPAKGVGPGEPCAPAGSVVFYLVDNEAPKPCVGLRNIVWSPTVPPAKPDNACVGTFETHLVRLGAEADNQSAWYEDACL